MFLEKIKNLLKSPKFLICCSIALLFGVFLLLGYPYSVAVIATPFIWMWGFLCLYYKTILFFTLLFVALFYVCPILLFALSKCRAYLSLMFAAFKYGYKIRIQRLPFLSLFGIKYTGDLLFLKKDEKYEIHFLDIPYRFSRVLTVINGEEYVVSKVGPGILFSSGRGEKRYGFPGDVKRLGIIRTVEHTLEYDERKVKSLPDFSNDSEKLHVLMCLSVPVDARAVGKRFSGTLTSGEELASMTFYYPSGFVRLLKRNSE